MERAKTFLTAMLDVGKVVAMVVAVASFCGGLVHGVLWLGGRAGATEVAAQFARIDGRQSVTEARLVNEQEWRRVIYDQLLAVAKRVGAPVISPPAMGPETKGDATR